MTPENGGKIQLKLGQATSETAEYEATLQTPVAIWRASVRVGASLGKQQLEFGRWRSEASSEAVSEPPEWLTNDARAALKAALRTNQTEGHWPRRLTRWRPAPG